MFDPKEVKRWRRTVWREFERGGYSGIEIMAAMVLAAIAGFGTDPDVLSELTGSSVEYCKKITRRLRKAGVVRGQSIRAAWMQEGFQGQLAVMLDAGVAAGIFTRPVDPKRSEAQKARAPETRARGPRKPRTKLEPGTPFTPTLKNSNPFYGLPEWDKSK